jgi:hypothetical protein
MNRGRATGPYLQEKETMGMEHSGAITECDCDDCVNRRKQYGEVQEKKMAHYNHETGELTNDLHAPELEHLEPKPVQVPAASPWIKVSERLPEIHRLVIIKTVCGFYRLAEFGGVNFVTTNGGCLHKNNAAYWAEINPPAEEK